MTTLPPVTQSEKTVDPGPTHLLFLLYLSSSQNITHYTTTQSVPYKWIEAFEMEDAAGKGVTLNGWVEDVLVDALRVGLEVVGQEYIAERMGWGKVPQLNRKGKEGEGNISQEKPASG